MFSNYNNDFTKNNAEITTFNAVTVPWLALIDIDNPLEISSQYAHVCMQHMQAKKWVLIINPDEASLEQLAKTHGVDVSKVLCVNLKNKLVNTQPTREISLDIEQIKGVLTKGNCSAVILSNATFNQQEMSQLNACAQQGQTQCVLLKKHATTNQVLH